MVKINSKIIRHEVVTTTNPMEKITMQDPIILPDKLDSKRYKIKPPGCEDALYINISDYEINGTLRPVEIFLTSKNMESFQWITLLTRITSWVLRTPGPFPKGIIDEYLCIHDPKGGYIIPMTEGQWTPSVAAHVGLILKEHCQDLGLIGAPVVVKKGAAMGKTEANLGPKAAKCPKCNEYQYYKEENCWICKACGDSKCG